MFFLKRIISENEWIVNLNNHKITIKREDKIDKWISGNKFRKLKYVFLKLIKERKKKILSFGGVFSNHLAALSKAGNLHRVKTFAIVRGKEWEDKIIENPTLKFCKKNGMDLHFVSRDEYRLYDKGLTCKNIIDLNPQLEIIPEGGSSKEAMKGCMEILTSDDKKFDVICVSVGTGGTISGIIESSYLNQFVLGFLSLKYKNMSKEIFKNTSKTNWSLIDDYTFNGYGKISIELINFVNHFYKKYRVPIDPIYNAKMVFGIFDMIKKNKWKWGKNILIINTGGLQGIRGMNLKLKQRGWEIIDY